MMVAFSKKGLLKFLVDAHKNTYAAPSEIKDKFRSKPILEHHQDYDYVDGNWRYHDSYAGIHWAPGREVVFFEGKPVWCMSYQGRIPDDFENDLIENMFAFLKKAMRHMDETMPFRGPKEFKEDDFVYSFKMEGDYSYFTGREIITYKGKEVFRQDIIGGLIK